MAYRLEEDRGSIEVGKRADLLVLNADPLADIGNIRHIDEVILEGTVIDRDSLPVKQVLEYDPELPWPY